MSYDYDKERPAQREHENAKFRKVVVTGLAAFTVVGVSGLAGCPMYNVYSSRMAGEAELAQANYSKQVAVQTALAKRDSSTYEAQAEVIRAGGVAQANKIIGDSLKNNEAYLRYLFVNGLEHTQNQVSYIPTEAQLPILEANPKVHQ